MRFLTRRASRTIEPAMTRYIYKRDEGMCVYCGLPATDIDHIIPTRLGGLSIKGNLVCSCHSCNVKKANHFENPLWFVRAFRWLVSKEEDVSWMDTF